MRGSRNWPGHADAPNRNGMNNRTTKEKQLRIRTERVRSFQRKGEHIVKPARQALAAFLCVLILFGGSACGKSASSAETEEPISPEDFALSIVWGVYGISSYDSRTGRLVKTKDTSDIDRYTATVTLSVADKNAIYRCLFSDIDLTAYPDSYDPFDGMVSKPNQTVIVSATADGQTKTVTCKGIALASAGLENCRTEEAAAFWASVTAIVDRLTSLPEWEAFPPYERLYQGAVNR